MGVFPKIFKEVERHMNKKVLSLVLALVIVLGTFGTVVAADEYSTQDQKIQWLIDNEIVIGRNVNADGSADLALNEYLTRAEVTKLIVYTLKLQNLADALKGVMQPFPDVDINHWANGYVSVATTQRADVANGRRIVIGYPDGKFYPNNNVTYAELATMLVRIVKKDLTDAMEKNAIWATSYMRWAEEEGILKGLTIADSNKPVPRKDAFEMIFNAMYALGDYNNGAVNFGDQLGIVSKLQAGEIQLNQDPEKVYKITASTMITDGTSWRSLSANLDRAGVGSLVRVIVNADKEVTHLLELGNQEIGALGRDANSQAAGRNHRWFSVADNTVGGTANFKDNYIDTKVITVNGLEARWNANTRFFVADARNNALKEVKDLGEVFNWYATGTRNIERVYMGYNTVAGRNEAKVIVFGQVDKYQGAKDVRRVTRWLTSGLRFEAEDTKGATTIYDINDTPLFPSRDIVDRFDVVDIRLNAYYPNLRDGILIDYSEDNVYRVVSTATGRVTLADEYRHQAEFYLPSDAKIFLEGQLKKDAHVQIRQSASDNKELEIVSVVNKDLKGALPEGVRVGTNKGFLVDVRPVTGNTTAGYRYIARFAATADGRGVNDYYVTELDAAILGRYLDANIGRELTFDVREELGGTKVAFNFVYTQAELNRLAIAAIEAYKANPTQANYDAAQAIINQMQAGEANRIARQKELDAAREANKPVADARITNNGECAIRILAVNGVRLSSDTVVNVIAPGSTVRTYINNNGQTVNLKTGDKVIVTVEGLGEGCASGNCELVGFRVAKTCAAGNLEGVSTIPLRGETDPCGNIDCTLLRCAAEIELSCITDIEAVGVEENVSGLRDFTFQVAQNGEVVFTQVGGNPYYTFENMEYNAETGRVTGTIVLTQAGIDAGVVIRGNEPVEGTHDIIDEDEVRVNSANVSFRVQGCTDGCEGKFQIRVWIDQPCKPCYTVIN